MAETRKMTKEKKQTSKALPTAKPSKPATAIPGNWKAVWKEYEKLDGGEARAALLARYVLPRIRSAFAEWHKEVSKAGAALSENLEAIATMLEQCVARERKRTSKICKAHG